KELPPAPGHNALVEELHKKYGGEFKKRYMTEGKLARYAALDELKKQVLADYQPKAEGAAAPGAEMAAARVRDQFLPEGEVDPRHDAEKVSAAYYALRERI